MIDFKNNGEFKVPASTNLNGHAIIGLGSAGVNIVDQIVLDHRDSTALFCFDTDEQTIRGSVVNDKLLLGQKRIHGLGTGGDPSLAAEIIREERQEIISMLQGVRSAVLVGGLGGGTGSGMAPEFCRILKQLGATVIVAAVTPFGFEGKRRLHQAGEALAEVKQEADALLCLSNSRLMNLPGQETDIRRGFATMNGLVGRACLNLRAVLNQKGPMQLHLADLRNLLAEHDCGGMTLENCWTGFGIGSGSDRAREVVDEVLSGPLFADGQAWSKGSAVIACLGGGKNLSMGEFQTVIEYLKQEIPVELPILAGTILDAYETDALSLTLMVIGQTPEEETPKAKEELALTPAEPKTPEPPVGNRIKTKTVPATPETTRDDDFLGTPGTEQRYFAQQEELPLDKKIYRGRFEKSAPTILNGEDLDQPTFMRQNIKIRQ